MEPQATVEDRSRWSTAQFAAEITRILGTPKWRFEHRSERGAAGSAWIAQEIDLEDREDLPPHGQYRLAVYEPNDAPYDRMAAFFMLERLPGCCGVCVSHSAMVEPKFRGSGLGSLLNALRIAMARTMGYGTLLGTDVTNNPKRVAYFERNGWADLHTFENPRTLNKVVISVRDLGAA